MKSRFRMILVAVLLSGVICLLGITSALAMKYNEAPMLRTMVAAGELPPVEERLPEEPMVVKSAVGEIGVYGGVATTTPWPPHYMADEYLISTEVPGYVKSIPNVIKGWKINENATEVTFYLREGMKWSDGYPFTADDFLFWYNDIEGNKELSPIRGTWYAIGGEHGVMAKIDDYTIKWTFAATFGSFIDSLSEWPVRGRPQCAPAHYLKRFHADYVLVEQLKETMKEKGFDTWMNLFGTMNNKLNNPELPVLGPWVAMNEWGSEIQIWERNPYFWKVDPEGNQLPYIDRVEVPRSAGMEADLLRLIAGEIDFCGGQCMGGRNYTIVMENQERGNYRLIRKTEGDGAANIGSLYLNIHHKDPAKRELFNNLDFRKALSVAINRWDINTALYNGNCPPTQVAPATGPPYHGERPEFKEYYIQYDPELANQLLDGIGLTERDGRGYRLGPDGKKLLIILQVVSGWISALPAQADMYKQYFTAVGLNTIVKPMPDENLTELVNAVEHDIYVRYFAGGNILQSPANGYLFPRGAGWHTSPLWARWLLTNGEEGEEPPTWVKRLAQIDGEAKAIVDFEKRVALYTEAVLLHVNELMPIGGLGAGGGPGAIQIFSNRVRNVPDPVDMHLVGGSSQLSSWYILEEDQ